MHALIFCAGKGKRLRPLTYFKAKPLVEIAGKPVVEHLIEHLLMHGVTEIMINLHYKAMDFMNHLGSRVDYFYEPKLMGEMNTLEYLYRTRPRFKEKFLVMMNGDTLTNINLTKMFKLSKGNNVKAMDEKIYTGTSIVSPNYLKNKRFYEYRDPKIEWFDIGTYDGLVDARRHYEKAVRHLPSLSGDRQN